MKKTLTTLLALPVLLAGTVATADESAPHQPTPISLHITELRESSIAKQPKVQKALSDYDAGLSDISAVLTAESIAIENTLKKSKLKKSTKNQLTKRLKKNQQLQQEIKQQRQNQGF